MGMTFFAERLRSARLLLGLDNSELSVAARLDHSVVTAIERGQCPLTVDSAEAVARVTQLPLSFFAVRSAEVPRDSLRLPEDGDLSARMRDRIRQLFAEALRVTEVLFEETRYSLPRLPVEATSADRLSGDRIESVAEHVRAALGLGPDGHVPYVMRALERHGVAVAPLILPGSTDAQCLAPGHFGVSFWSGFDGPALVGFFPGARPDRDRFTLAHELGHLVLHSRRHSVDAEWEANRFASAFLIPAHRAAEIFGPDATLIDFARAKAEWGLSIQALIVRAAELGLIGADRAASLCEELRVRGWRHSEPVEVVAEEPVLLWRMLVNRFGPSPYRSSMAAERLGLPPFVLRALAPEPTHAAAVPPPSGQVHQLRHR
ncbi:protein of unknown function [Actinopolymorpha cephalotaxi]|uniref:Transcriptional regulator with XRE-family HTH domain n=1 Tax=Actinopolymorpha cephalotaxi TaxID=504797 RepID=A0A1I2U727_9ACTN|nr:XRE family transcriptional regulator [Actinopolymorpha cephalotaxi]NYH86443.1 transcriptional regulator with XRE-family HTH domain [Actinopolymorpha cephalotaxi]SFG72169.1 protein of unknown function [Actinopolymorpha cephalotaxi]